MIESFYFVFEGFNLDTQKRIELFRLACEERKIKFNALNALDFNFLSIPKLGHRDGLYKIGRGAKRLESLLLNDEVITFFKSNPGLWFYNCTTEFDIALDKAGINIPKTIHFATSTDRGLLNNYVQHLGGFPVILKIPGGTMGFGVLKIDSIEALISTMEYLEGTNKEIVLKQFIPNYGTARLIVLGNDVICSFFRTNLQDDFRVSGTYSGNNYSISEYSPEINKLAIEAVHCLGLETAGVDIIFQDGMAYVIEVNYPFGLVIPTEVTGVDIAGKMVDYLINKSK
jgi:glutathione synthase/RimK-type ligase-like ATP-grasp enzyme